MFKDYEGIINDPSQREAYFTAYENHIDDLNRFGFYDAAEIQADNLHFIKTKLERLGKPGSSKTL